MEIRRNFAFPLISVLRLANNLLILPFYKGMDKTTLNFVDWRGDMIYATNVSKVTIRDIHLTRDTPGATQVIFNGG